MSNSEVFKSLLKDIKEALIEDAIEKYNQQGEGLNHFKEMYSRLKNYYEDNSNINDILNTVKLTLIDFDKNVKINVGEEDIKFRIYRLIGGRGGDIADSIPRRMLTSRGSRRALPKSWRREVIMRSAFASSRKPMPRSVSCR